MDFTFDAELETFRREVRELLDEVVDPAVHERVRATGTHHDERMARAMGARGWLRSVVPGTDGADPLRLHVLFGEMERAGAPYDALASNLLVAGILGPAAMSFYGMAWSASRIPVWVLSQALGLVLVPTLTHVRSDMGRVERVLRESLRHAYMLLMPACVALFVIADSLVTTVLGAKCCPWCQLCE